MTVNATKGEISVNAGAEHYAIFTFASATVNVGADFTFNIANGAEKYYGGITEN